MMNYYSAKIQKKVNIQTKKQHQLHFFQLSISRIRHQISFIKHLLTQNNA